MSKERRRVHSSIHKLPKILVTSIDGMMVDNAWPGNFQGNKAGKPRYVDMVEYCRQQGYQVHISSVGRYCRGLKDLASMKETAREVAEAMKARDGENVSEAQKAAGELLTALILEAVTEKDKFSPKEIAKLASAAKDCNQVVITANKYINQQMRDKAEKAKEDIRLLKPKKEISSDALKAIKEQVYGIIDTHLGIK